MSALLRIGSGFLPTLLVAIICVYLPGTGTAQGTAVFRVVHVSKNGPEADVFASGQGRVFENLAYPGATTYRSVNAGVYTIDISQAGMGAGDAFASVSSLNMEAGKAYTIFVYDQGSQPRAIPVVDFLEPPFGNRTRFRFDHFSGDLGLVDFIQLFDASTLLVYPSIEFGEISTFLDSATGDYRLGMDFNSDGDPELAFPGRNFPVGAITDVIVLSDNGAPFLVFVSADAQVSTLHPVILPETIAHTFNEGREGWAYINGAGFDTSFGNYRPEFGRLDIQPSNNKNCFGFWESDLFEMDDSSAQSSRAAILDDPNALFTSTFVVGSDQVDPTLVPVIRLRQSVLDFQRTEVFVATSAAAAGIMPGTAGNRLYKMFFSQPTGQNMFRMDFDLLNVDPLDALQPVVFLDAADIAVYDKVVLPSPQQVVAYDFTNGNQNGFTPQLTGFPFTPDYAALPQGIAMNGTSAVDTGSIYVFGYWGLTSDIAMEANTLYELAWTVNATTVVPTREAPPGALNVPTFRLRINDSSLQCSQYVNIESSGAVPESPVGGRTYYQYFATPPEVAGNDFIFSFDFLWTNGADNNPYMNVALESLSVKSYALPQP